MAERKFKPDSQENAWAPVAPKSAMTALKDFEIHHNDYHRVIRTGDDLSDVPEVYLANLKTECVL